MTSKPTYRESHTKSGKGEHYDARYARDRWRSFVWAEERDCLDEIVATNLSGKRIRLLDFAVGTGRIARHLEPLVDASTGVDVSESMLGEARKNLTTTELLLGDITKQSMLGARRFDLITAFRFFANAEPDLRSEAMGRLVDHLDEDGILVFNNHLLPNAMHLRTWRAWRRLRRQDEPAVHTMSLYEAISLAESSGLRIVSVHRVGFLHLPKMELPRWLMNTAEKLARGLRLDKRFSETVILTCKLETSRLKVTSDVVRKSGAAEWMRIEAAKTERAARIAAETDTFLVPAILSFDPRSGTLELENLRDFVSIGELVRSRFDDTVQLGANVGKAIACVHTSLETVDAIDVPRPWADLAASDDLVLIHGDLTTENVGWDPSVARVVILDWSAAPELGVPATRGPAMFDLVWFCRHVHLAASWRTALGWPAREFCDSFLSAYVAESGSLLSRSGWSRFHAESKAVARRNAIARVRNAAWFKRPLKWLVMAYLVIQWSRYRPPAGLLQ